MKHYTLFSLVLMAGLLFTGCDVENTYPSPGNNDDKTIEELRAELVNGNWELRSVEKGGYGIFAPEEDTMYTLTFFEDGSFEGKDLCNQCGGEYEIDSLKNLDIPEFICTEMACYGYQHRIDFSTALHGSSKPFYFENDRLYITVTEDEEEPENYKFAENSSLKEVIMANPANFKRSEWPNSGHHMLEATISGDSLFVNVGYSGCEPHDLNIVFYNYFMESFPVQAYAVVTHKNEACRAAFTSDKTFDLKPLKKDFQQSYGEEGTIDISIRQQDTTLKKIRYSF